MASLRHSTYQLCALLLACIFTLGLLPLVSACGMYSGDNMRNGIDSSSTNPQSSQDSSIALSLPSFYGESMVFQRDRPIMIRGSIHSEHRTIDASKLHVTLGRGSMHNSSIATITGDQFKVVLPALPASVHPYVLTVDYNNQVTITIDKVYVGDVFVAAGQSNMELNYAQYYGDPKQASANLGSAFKLDDLPEFVADSNIHFIVAAHNAKSKDFPVDSTYEDAWQTCRGDSAKHLGYLPQFFAEQLRKQEPEVPVGIIQTAWGGTGIDRHVSTGDIYANHIKPLTGFNIAGILWYQGCDDAWQLQPALAYCSKFTALINQYRNVFGQDDLPFLYVQLARWAGAHYTQYIREAQLETMNNANLKQPENVAMTVSIDTDKGTSSVIHPLGKEILAARMAEQFKAIRMNSKKGDRMQKTIPLSPLALTASRNKDGSATIAFRAETAQKLQIRKPMYSLRATPATVSSSSREPLEGFEVADDNGNFVPAEASIKGSSVEVRSNLITHITQVRYLWEGDPQYSNLLYNGEGLPASPFVLSVS